MAFYTNAALLYGSSRGGSLRGACRLAWRTCYHLRGSANALPDLLASPAGCSNACLRGRASGGARNAAA